MASIIFVFVALFAFCFELDMPGVGGCYYAKALLVLPPTCARLSLKNRDAQNEEIRSGMHIWDGQGEHGPTLYLINKNTCLFLG